MVKQNNDDRLPLRAVFVIVDRLLVRGYRVRRIDPYTLRATCPCCDIPDSLEIRSDIPIPFLEGVDGVSKEKS